MDLAKYIDHTLLRPDATQPEIDKMCDEAMEYGFASVCINPTWVKRAAERLRGSDVKVCTVIGFPLGATPPEIKAMEARRALRDGAREVDMVINVGALKSGDTDLVLADIEKVVDAAHEVGAIAKVIIETSLLSDEEKVVASALASKARADFVKTSTGFTGTGATVYDVALMRETVGPNMGVKASGGVRTLEDAEDMIAAGATRIGASAGIQIVGGNEGDGDGERY
ncbi:MAG: deoxyribose-phosphate aldolase [Armatimonadetes bacterium]|nr:MAG: deoxyribose-phosphate aldolase [Armatimonadota bacterium]